jgi:hypothetical protein
MVGRGRRFSRTARSSSRKFDGEVDLKNAAEVGTTPRRTDGVANEGAKAVKAAAKKKRATKRAKAEEKGWTVEEKVTESGIPYRSATRKGKGKGKTSSPPALLRDILRECVTNLQYVFTHIEWFLGEKKEYLIHPEAFRDFIQKARELPPDRKLEEALGAQRARRPQVHRRNT